MSDNVQFEEDNASSFRSRVILGQLKTPKMIQFLMNRGIVKDEKSAGSVLFVVIIICVVLMIIISYMYIIPSKQKPVPLFSPEEYVIPQINT